MPAAHHWDVRTTLAIDDSTYARLQAEMRKRGCSFREVVNESLRHGLDALQRPSRRQRVELPTFPGGPRPGIDLDKVCELLDEADGPLWR
jgi:hypothetical protein